MKIIKLSLTFLDYSKCIVMLIRYEIISISKIISQQEGIKKYK